MIDLGMIVFLTFFVLFISNNFFLFLMNLYLVPQIVHNVMRGGRVDFDLNYMLVIGLRAFLPVKETTSLFNNNSSTLEDVLIISWSTDLLQFSVSA